MGKATLAYLLFAEKQLDEVEKITKQLEKDFPQLPPAVQLDVEPMLAPLPLYSTYGRADVIFKSNEPQKYTKVAALLKPLVERIAKKAGTTPLPEGIEAALPRIILFLYLKSCLLDGKINEANEALNMIQAGSGFENQGQVLAALVKDLSDQMAELKKKGKDGEAEYNKARANFAAFLDSLAKQDLGKVKPELLRFLAHSYASMERYEVAAELLKKIPEPPAGTKVEEFKSYHAMRLLLARMYRLAKKYDDCGKVLKELEKTDFATHSLEYREELILLNEDQDKWALAANG
jgi:hypothetical protein